MPRYLSPAPTPSTLAGAYGGKKIYYTSNNTWTVPGGVSCATFEIWGGGGAGSPMCCCTCYGGFPGGSGAYSFKTIAVTPGTTYTVVVGAGGTSPACWFSSNPAGCPGGKTYVTGTNLTNFCAEGGVGGGWCSQPCLGVVAAAYGGDLNLSGRHGSINYTAATWHGAQCGIQSGGPAPMGGGYNWFNRAVGDCASSHACAPPGSFPGGGGVARPTYVSGWCDCCAGCTGSGGNGLVIITI